MKKTIRRAITVMAVLLVGTAAAGFAACGEKTYTVTWDVNGEIVTEQYREGEMPYFKGETDRDGTATITYDFKGWNAAVTAVTADVTYVARYTATEQVTDKAISLGVYTGTLVDGIPTGTGKLVIEGEGEKPGWTYEGTFTAGMSVTGIGKMTFTNGEISEGDFVNGQLHGWGFHDFNNGCMGVGNWENGNMNGTMWFTWSDGSGSYDVYIGKWVDGKRMDENGFYTFANGCWYRGEFNDWINGKGEFHWGVGGGENYFRGMFENGSPVKDSYGYGRMDGVEGYIAVGPDGGWSWYNGTTEDGKTVVNGQVVEN